MLALIVCTDCFLYISTGTLPENKTDAAFVERGAARFRSMDAGEALGFMWLPCQCCGSTLGGERYRATAKEVL